MKVKQIATTLATAILSLAILSSLNAEVFTQTYTTTPCENYELITEMLIGPGVARHPKGVRIPQAKEYQIGVFSNMVAKVIPTFTNGVILSTGNINQGGRLMTGGSLTNETSTAYWDGEAVWPDGTPPQYGSDKDLTNYFGKAELYDQAGIVLYIQPKNKTLNIPFVMASEEYFFDSDYFDSKTQEKYEQNSDKFAFFLKEIASVTNSAAFDTDGNVIDDGSLMTPYWNVAQLPGGGDVEISSVNQYTNTQYFISNVVTNEDEELLFPAYDIQLPIEYNGAIAGPVAVAENLDTNKIYKLKIIIADDGNNIVNSAVFLRARGITSGADLSNGVSGPAKLEVPGTATFTDVVTNIDAAAADDVKVTHYLPVDIKDADLPAIKASVTCTAGEVKPESWGKQGETNYFVWTIGSRFASGSNAVLTVNCPLPRTGIYQNITKVETSTGDMNAGNDRGECVTVVGDVEKPVLTVTAIETNKIYGTELPLAGLQFVKSIDGTNGTEIVARSVTVTYTNELGVTVTPVKVGKYGIILSNIRGDNLSDDLCDITYVDGVLTIEPAPLTITACDTNKLYGTELSFSGKEFSVSGLIGDDKVETVTLASEGTAEDKKCKPEGYPIIASEPITGSGLENYVLDFQPGTLIIDQLEIEITPVDRTKPYGQQFKLTPKSFEITKGELLPGDKINSVSMTSDGASATAAASEVGYDILADGATGIGLENYAITYGTGTLYVAKFRIMIAADDTNKVYGTALNLDPTAFSVLVQEPGQSKLPNDEEVLTVTLESANATNEFAAAGVYEGDILPSHVITGNPSFKTNNYEIAFSNGTLTVTKAPLTIIADGTNRVYGTTVGFTGREFTTKPLTLPNDEKVETVTITSTYAGDPTADAGTYLKDIVPSHVVTGSFGFKTNNYDIVFSNGTLTVMKAPLTIIANSTNKVFGTEVQLDGTEFTTKPVTLPNHETVTNVTLTCPQTTNLLAAVGMYPIVPSHTVWGEDFNTNNYAIVFSNGTLKVTQADLTVIANDTNKVYNTTITFAGNEFTTIPATLPEGIAVSSVTLTSEKATSAATAAGTYKNEIVPSAAQGTGLDNYKIAYSNGTLTVTQADLMVIANDTNKVYNTTITFAGTEFTTLPATLPNGDAVTSVTLTSAKAADALTDVGTYVKEIQPSAAQGNGLENYAIAYSNGTLKVTQAALTVIANDTNKVYNTTITFAGNEFTTLPATLPTGVAVNAVTLTSEKAANAATAVGTYKGEIVPSNAVGTKLNNYDIAYSNGTLKVTKAGLTITANNASKAYGTVKTFTGKEFTTLPATLPAGIAVTSVTLTSAKAASAATAAGTYKNEIVPSAAVGTGLDNYSITYSKGTLTVSKVPLTIIADDKSRVYGSTLSFTGKEFTTLPTALPNGDKVGTVTLTSAKGADASTVVGTYPKAIVPSHIVTGINTNNYDITFSNGTLNVTQAALTVKVNDAKWNIKKPKPTYSFADFTSQLKGGDTVASVAGSAGLSQSDFTNKVWATAVPVKGDEGVYTDEIWIKLTSINGPRAANYLITVDPGDLTVDTALPELKIDLSWALSGDTGLLWPIMTVENVGDGEVESDSNYWVELKPVDSPKCSLWSKTGTMPDGYDYQDLTATVKAALKKIGNKDEAFDPGEKLTFDPTSKADTYPYVRVSEKSPQDLGVRVYHVNRKNPLVPPITPNMFFIAGQLFNAADTTHDFKVSDAEKSAAAAILGTSSADYLEVTRLNLLQYYHWNTAAGTWIGPSK